MTKRTPARRSPPARLTAVPRRSGPFAPVEAAIAAMREGRIAIVVDDEDRENEGDFTVAAEKITPEIVNFSFFPSVCSSQRLRLPVQVTACGRRRQTPTPAATSSTISS